VEGPGQSRAKLASPRRRNRWLYVATTLTGELYDDDKIRSFHQDDIVNLDAEDREAIAFEAWLWEYLLHGVFYEEENEDAQ